MEKYTDGTFMMFESQEVKSDTPITIKIPAIKDWSITDLRRCCKKNKVKGYTNMNKDQLIEAVKAILDNMKSK